MHMHKTASINSYFHIPIFVITDTTTKKFHILHIMTFTTFTDFHTVHCMHCQLIHILYQHQQMHISAYSVLYHSFTPTFLGAIAILKELTPV
jgi:hypothetical protein